MRRSGRADSSITLVALAALLAWDATGWDLAFARWYGTTAGFVWRDAWLTRSLLHDGGRWLARALLGLLVLDAVRPAWPGPGRAERWWWIAVMLAGALLVPSIKQISTTSCPWELAEFGGVARYVSHWQFGSVDGGPGHCFPSGHAVAAFAFFGVYFLWRPYRPVLADFSLVAVLLAGAAFGWAQLARGAHYPSHTLWSAWLCWTLCVIGDRLRPGRRIAAGAVGDSVDRLVGDEPRPC
ncbi:phosphatase PAP2 family protein [Accumulibacter sp.]|uniref:phosphatase PAP2 family protein n=1 Tax=Accumulibacter sp. TaxID=2053492 RepID=UPI002611EDCF|nr:phosphatase PAP2 family protein [Accumulibacter sp.]